MKHKDEETDPMKRTTIMLSERLWIEAKVRAARERKDAQDILAEALEAFLFPKKKGGTR